MASLKGAAASNRRVDLRDQLWPESRAWVAEKGFFQAPRTLPLLMSLISSKEISGKKDASTAYFELWARNWGEGIVEITDEHDHAFAAGYEGTRALRTWRERIYLLEKAGFIKIAPIGGRQVGAILLVHPQDVLDKLRADGRIKDNWWNAYVVRKTKTGDNAQPAVIDEKPKIVRLKAARKP